VIYVLIIVERDKITIRITMERTARCKMISWRIMGDAWESNSVKEDA
jgi:hypothetical protein